MYCFSSSAKCPICLENYNGVNGKCGHTSCALCVSKLVKNSKTYQVKCALCYKDTKVQENSLIHSNYDLSTSKEEKIPEVHLSNQKCDNCGNNDYHCYCEECKEYLCMICDQHNHQLDKKALHTRREVYNREYSFGCTDMAIGRDECRNGSSLCILISDNRDDLVENTLSNIL